MEPSIWREVDNALIKEFTFPTFLEAISFINGVAAIAEDMQHHPEITNTYTSVILRLSTHDAGDVVTEKDYALAHAIDAILI